MINLADRRPYTLLCSFFVFIFCCSWLPPSYHRLISHTHSQCLMEFLYTDRDGVVPTSGCKVMPVGQWIALNTSTGKIPSTEVFQQALEDQVFQMEESCTLWAGHGWRSLLGSVNATIGMHGTWSSPFLMRMLMSPGILVKGAHPGSALGGSFTSTPSSRWKQRTGFQSYGFASSLSFLTLPLLGAQITLYVSTTYAYNWAGTLLLASTH